MKTLSLSPLSTSLSTQTHSFSGGVVDLPSLGDISKSLARDYAGLDKHHQAILKRMYRGLFSILKPFGYMDVLALVHVLPLVLKQSLTFKCTLSEFMCLAKVYFYSQGGQYPINLQQPQFITTRQERMIIQKFMRAGFLHRSSFDPLHPYNIRLRQKSFLTFTEAGLLYYRGVIKQCQYNAGAGFFNMVMGTYKKT